MDNQVLSPYIWSVENDNSGLCIAAEVSFLSNNHEVEYLEHGQFGFIVGCNITINGLVHAAGFKEHIGFDDVTIKESVKEDLLELLRDFNTDLEPKEVLIKVIDKMLEYGCTSEGDLITLDEHLDSGINLYIN